MRNDYMDSLEFPTDKQETEKVKYSKSFEEIFNWFFSLDTDEQMKTISITNNNLTKNIIIVSCMHTRPASGAKNSLSSLNPLS